MHVELIVSKLAFVQLSDWQIDADAAIRQRPSKISFLMAPLMLKLRRSSKGTAQNQERFFLCLQYYTMEVNLSFLAFPHE
jgi:hypothetical protein